MLYLTQTEFNDLIGPINLELEDGSPGHIEDHVSIAAKLNLLPYSPLEFRKVEGEWEILSSEDTWSPIDEGSVQYYATMDLDNAYVVTDQPYSGGVLSESSVTTVSCRIPKTIQSISNSIDDRWKNILHLSANTDAVVAAVTLDLTKTTYTRTRTPSTGWGAWNTAPSFPIQCVIATVEIPGGSQIPKILSGKVTAEDVDFAYQSGAQMILNVWN